MNRLPAAGMDEVSSPNSVASSFRMDFGLFKSCVNIVGVGNKRNSESAGGEPERASSRASDDDENGANTRKKLRLSKEQSAYLEESFKEHHTLNPVSINKININFCHFKKIKSIFFSLFCFLLCGYRSKSWHLLNS